MTNAMTLTYLYTFSVISQVSVFSPFLTFATPAHHVGVYPILHTSRDAFDVVIKRIRLKAFVCYCVSLNLNERFQYRDSYLSEPIWDCPLIMTTNQGFL